MIQRKRGKKLYLENHPRFCQDLCNRDVVHLKSMILRRLGKMMWKSKTWRGLGVDVVCLWTGKQFLLLNFNDNLIIISC